MPDVSSADRKRKRGRVGGSRANEITIVAHEVRPTGGMERQLTELIAGCLADDREVTVLGRNVDLPRHPGLRIVRVPGPGSPLPLHYPLFEAQAAWLLRRHAVGIVHTAGAIVPGKVDVVTVHFCHRAYNILATDSRARRNTLPYRVNARLSSAISEAGERWSYRTGRIGATIAISHGVRREIERFYPELVKTLSVIPHGVDANHFRPDSDRSVAVRGEFGMGKEDLVAVFVGGDWARKGLEHAIRAIAHAPPWRLLVVGPGEPGQYQELANELGVRDRVTFGGPSSDPAQQLAAADVFLLPTSYETFSLVTYEAAACGLPLLVTRVSGPDELIDDGVNGYFLDVDEQTTAGFLRALAGNDSMRARMGRAARQAVLPFSWASAVAAHLETYDRLMTERK